MLQKLARQTAVYGISTIAVRFLSYLLTPLYTRMFEQEAYGIITDVYALIPFALVLLTMGLESGYFRFAAKADAAAREAGGSDGERALRARAAKRRIFATAWGATLAAAVLFFGLLTLLREPVAALMGEAYAAHPSYVAWVAAVVLFDVASCLPFSRLREQGRAMLFVELKAASVLLNVTLAIAFGAAGLYATDFGAGWVFVANLVSSAATFVLVAATTDRTPPRIDARLLRTILVYSLPLLVGGIAGTANEIIDRQMIKYLVPAGAMAQLGIYGAITKIAVVMTLFTQMYRLAAEPFFLADYRKEDFVAMNAAALKYYVMASTVIFLGIALYKEFFALIVGRSFREGITILPVVLAANALSGVWLNLSFWYKREERTRFAIAVTFTGLLFTLGVGVALVPRWGYGGAAWARLAGEAAMVAVSYRLNRRYFPTPYDLPRMAEYTGAALLLFGLSQALEHGTGAGLALRYTLHTALLAGYLAYVVRREHIHLGALARSILKR